MSTAFNVPQPKMIRTSKYQPNDLVIYAKQSCNVTKVYVSEDATIYVLKSTNAPYITYMAEEDDIDVQPSYKWVSVYEGGITKVFDTSEAAVADIGPTWLSVIRVMAPIVPVAAKPARVILNAPNKKDQAKSDRANKFIGRGVVNSWTHKYAQLWGDRANTGSYEASDVVFVSSNGSRPGSLKPNFVEIAKAVAAGATLITDTAAYRKNSSYNVGEREVATFLGNNGYEEDANGTWTPVMAK